MPDTISISSNSSSISFSNSPPSSPLSIVEGPKTTITNICSSADKLLQYDYPTCSAEKSNSNTNRRRLTHTFSSSEDESPLTQTDSMPLPDLESKDEMVFSSQPSGSQTKKKTKGRPKTVKDVTEMKRKREEKHNSKLEKKMLTEKIRQMKPGECLKYIVAVMDSSFIQTSWGMKMLETLQSQCEFNIITEEQPDPFTVTWKREVTTESNAHAVQEEKHILYCWEYKKLISIIKDKILLNFFKTAQTKYSGYKFYLAVYKVKNVHKRKRTSRNSDVSSDNEISEKKKLKVTDEGNDALSWDEIEMALTELQVFCSISHRFVNFQELVIMIQTLTKSVAEIRYKNELEKQDSEKSWYAKGDSRNCVRIDKNLNGLKQLWIQQLLQFNLSTLDIAKSIVEVYPTPLTLYQAYKSLSTKKEKEQLLQDIIIRKRSGVKSSKKRVGPELSKKISLLFSQENGDILLSQSQ